MRVQCGHVSLKTGIARSAGRSSTASAAYRAGISITDDRTGEIYDYTRKGGVEYSQVIVPSFANKELQAMAEQSRNGTESERAKAQAAFWNENEKAHKRGDSIVAREVEVDLPHELSSEERKALAESFAKEMAEKWGFGVQMSIHEPRKVSDKDLEKDPDKFYVIDEQTGERHNGNWHVHFLITTKEINQDGFGNKVKEFDPMERKFKPSLENPTDWIRPRWESMVQERLDHAGIDKIYTTRSNGETRKLLIEKGHYELAAKIGEPTRHLGPAAAEMQRNGKESERADINDSIRADNLKYADRAELAETVLDKLTSQKSIFTERDLYGQLCKSADERLGDELHELVGQCLAREDVVILGTNAKGKAVFTTRQMQDIESKMAAQSAARKSEGRHAVNPEKLDSHAEKNGLSEEQRLALHHMSGKDGVALVEGMAGTGKSTMMKAAKDAWTEAGYDVRGCALAGKAADGLEQGAGIKSQTVASLLLQLDNGKTALTNKTVLCVDEAGMLSSKMTARLVEHAAKSGAKLVMIGDDRQLQPIEAGGAFKALKNELGAARLTTIYRQKDEWARDAVHGFADGDAGRAIAEYAKRGLVAVGIDADDTKRQLVADWNSQRTDDGKSAIILAGTRKDVRALNELARAERVQAREIEQGERVKTEQGYRDFSQGDRIVFLKNDKKIGVKNGQLGTIEKLERDGSDFRLTVRGDDGKLASFNTRDYDRLDHGYATTVHKAQGVTIDRAYVLSGSMHDRELSYVSMSRSRQETRLYIDAEKYGSAAGLARQMSQSHQKGTTLDYDGPANDTENRTRKEEHGYTNPYTKHYPFKRAAGESTRRRSVPADHQRNAPHLAHSKTPQRTDSLRNLPRFYMDEHTDRGTMLLQGDAPHHMDDQRPDDLDQLRRLGDSHANRLNELESAKMDVTDPFDLDERREADKADLDRRPDILDEDHGRRMDDEKRRTEQKREDDLRHDEQERFADKKRDEDKLYADRKAEEEKRFDDKKREDAQYYASRQDDGRREPAPDRVEPDMPEIEIDIKQRTKAPERQEQENRRQDDRQPSLSPPAGDTHEYRPSGKHLAGQLPPAIDPENGRVKYSIGGSVAFEDAGSRLVFNEYGADRDDAIESGLKMANERWGEKGLAVHGTDEFKRRVVDVAVDRKLDLKFADKDLERQRQERMPQREPEKAPSKLREMLDKAGIKAPEKEHTQERESPELAPTQPRSKLREMLDQAGIKSPQQDKTQEGKTLALDQSESKQNIETGRKMDDDQDDRNLTVPKKEQADLLQPEPEQPKGDEAREITERIQGMVQDQLAAQRAQQDQQRQLQANQQQRQSPLRKMLEDEEKRQRETPNRNLLDGNDHSR